MNKRGISPLIATVLVIGFTIVLAALVFQWGGGLFKDIQEETSAQAELSMLCSSGVANTDVSAKHDGSKIVVTIDNKNQIDLPSYIVRLRDETGNSVAIDSDDLNEEGDTFYDTEGNILEKYALTIKTFALKQVVIQPDSKDTTIELLPAMKFVEFFPGVKPENGEVTICQQPFKKTIAD